MAVATVPEAGYIPFDAPLPEPRHDDLVAVSPPVDLTERAGWLAGAWSGGYAPGPAYSHDPCSTGTDRIKFEAGPIDTQKSRLFTIYQPALCTAQTIGRDPAWFIDRLEAIFAVYERAALERVLATGDGLSEIGPYLGDANMQLLAGDSVDPLSGLRLLEKAVALNGSGIIHAAPSTVVAWDALHLTVLRGELTYTRRGTPVAVGPGYTNVLPDDVDPLETDEQWAFATGPIQIQRSPVDIPASAYEQILDRSMNDVAVIAERTYLFNWIARQDPFDFAHTQAGVLINESRVGCCTVDGGSP